MTLTLNGANLRKRVALDATPAWFLARKKTVAELSAEIDLLTLQRNRIAGVLTVVAIHLQRLRDAPPAYTLTREQIVDEALALLRAKMLAE